MSVFLLKAFAKFARKVGLDDGTLIAAAEQIRTGGYDADLGGGLYKQRVAREDGGKSGGFRVLVAFRVGGHVFFIDGFAKNRTANVSAKLMGVLKASAKVLNDLSAEALEALIEGGA